MRYVRALAELVVAPPLDLELPDEDDQPFVEVAHAAGAAALVTGNPRHFEPVRGRTAVRVVGPREALGLFG
jgi:predicted nucleic acid-binding protein